MSMPANTSATANALLRQLSSLSEMLLAEARAGRWEVVAERQDERRLVAARLAALGASKLDAEMLDHVTRVDRTLREIAVAHRDELARRTRNGQRLGQATRGYRDIRRLA